MRYVIQIHFAASNNVAEYEALVKALRIAIELGVRRLDVQCNTPSVSLHVNHEHCINISIIVLTHEHHTMITCHFGVYTM